MNYFNGSVSEAIVKAKRENGIFIVFIYDKSELSQSTREKLKKEESATIFSLLKYVAIEVENGSKDAIQFAQIYPLIVVPSLFFISPTNGVPLEVIAGNVDSKTLTEKVKKISSENKDVATDANKDQNSKNEAKTAEENAETNNIPSFSNESNVAEEREVEQSANEETKESVPEEDSKADPVSSTTPEALIEPESTASASEPAPPLIEDRLARAQELISRRQEMKEVEEKEEEKQKEIERRRQSSEVAKAKQKREEQERIDINKQRKKEKEDDRLARERVKGQIAADKAERLARMAVLKGEDMPLPTGPVEEPPIIQQPRNQPRKEVTRIKFRFPDNSSQFSQFPAEATLRTVQTYLIETAKVPYSKFRLVGTLPPRTFTESDMPVSLQELGLSPSAIIIVKPITTTSTNLEPIRKSVILFFWTMLSPLVVIYQYLRGFLGLGTRETAMVEPSSDDEETQPKRPRTEGSYTTRNRPKTAYGKKGESGGKRGEGGFLRREGNIHRINQRGEDDDDDDNNTWNGNSTQQM